MGISPAPALSCDLRMGMAASSSPSSLRGGPFAVEIGFDDWRRAFADEVRGSGGASAGVEAGTAGGAAGGTGAGTAGGPQHLCVRLGAAFSLPGAPDCRRALALCRAAPPVFFLEFPAGFRYSPESRRHLDRVLRDFEGLPLAVLFLDPGWYSARVIEGLKERDVALCLADLPPGPGGPPSVDVVTSSLVYVRFYSGGRGRAEAWKPRIEALAARAERLRVIFEPGREAEARDLGLWWASVSARGGSSPQAGEPEFLP